MTTGDFTHAENSMPFHAGLRQRHLLPVFAHVAERSAVSVLRSSTREHHFVRILNQSLSLPKLSANGAVVQELFDLQVDKCVLCRNNGASRAKSELVR